MADPKPSLWNVYENDEIVTLADVYVECPVCSWNDFSRVDEQRLEDYKKGIQVLHGRINGCKGELDFDITTEKGKKED